MILCTILINKLKYSIDKETYVVARKYTSMSKFKNISRIYSASSLKVVVLLKEIPLLL